MKGAPISGEEAPISGEESPTKKLQYSVEEALIQDVYQPLESQIPPDGLMAEVEAEVAAIEAEVASLMAALGVLNINSLIKLDKGSKSLKRKLAVVTPLVEELRIQKEERMKQFPRRLVGKSQDTVSSIRP